MSSDLPKITVRCEDEKIKLKLRRIARKNGRSLSKECEQILMRFVDSYERKNGEVKV